MGFRTPEPLWQATQLRPPTLEVNRVHGENMLFVQRGIRATPL